MTSTNSTPPLNHLYRALCTSTCLWISRASSSSLSEMLSLALTTKAFGSSPAEGSWMAITAVSATPGWVRMWSSSSAGATWKPCGYQGLLVGEMEI